MRPTAIKQTDQNTITMTWDDGLTTPFTIQQLRDECPCAECKGEQILMYQILPVVKPKLPGHYDVKAIVPVGSYAVQITWGDGHATGLYSWEFAAHSFHQTRTINQDTHDEDSTRRLIRRAIQAKRTSYSPYSKFRVGASLLTDDGEIFDGCNVENASYGLSICAERNAVFRMASAGKVRLVAVAVTSDEPNFITPCGACRQVISEFADGKTEIVLVNSHGRSKSVKFEKLFPTPPKLEKLKK